MGVVGSRTDMGHPLNGQHEPSEPRRVHHLALEGNGHVHRGKELERPGGKIDVMGSTVDLGHLLNGHDGRLYPRGVHRLLA